MHQLFDWCPLERWMDAKRAFNLVRFTDVHSDVVHAHTDSFPDIFNYLKTQDKFRFQYELNAIVRDKGNKVSVTNLLRNL